MSRRLVPPQSSSPSPDSKLTRPWSDFQLGFALLGYFLLVVLLITLAPFRFQWPQRVHFLWAGEWFDILTNVVLFLPLGFLYRLARFDRRDSRGLRLLWLGLTLSTGIELTQIFLVGRYTSPMDVLTNGFGAWLGGLAHDQIQEGLSREWVSRFALQLPLMNLVYLLIPLIWLNGMAAGPDIGRRWLPVLLGICGAIILTAIYLHRLKGFVNLKPRTVSLAGGCWFALSVLPGFLGSPVFVLGAGLFVALLIQLLMNSPALAKTEQRRFELPVLKRVGSVYAIYLSLLALWPLPPALQTWQVSLGFPELSDDPSVISVLRLVEYFAAFTLLGYMIAESHGRSAHSRGPSFQRTLLWCTLAAGSLEILRGFHPWHVASFAQGILALGTSLYGAMIYWSQLASVQRIVASQPLDAESGP